MRSSRSSRRRLDTLMCRRAASILAQVAVSSSSVMVTFLITRCSCIKDPVSPPVSFPPPSNGSRRLAVGPARTAATALLREIWDRGTAGLAQQTGGIGERSEVPELLRIAHRTDRLHLVVGDVQRHDRYEPPFRIREERAGLPVHLRRPHAQLEL